jgi:hypothetical protein
MDRFVIPALPLFIKEREGEAKFWFDDGGDEEKEGDAED